MPISANLELNKEILACRHILRLILDGQDGCGKGTVADIIIKYLRARGAVVIPVAYPMYELPWGAVLEQLLGGHIESLGIRERMLVFALNRLETVPALREAVETADGKPTTMVFDRSFTSNTITLAYWMHAHPHEVQFSPESVEEFYQYMLAIDDRYITEMGLEQWDAWIPLARGEEVIKRMENDSTRAGRDQYEQVGVQDIAAAVYRQMEHMHPDRIHCFDQRPPGQSRNMTPKEIAEKILNSALPGMHDQPIGQEGRIIVPDFKIETIDTSLLDGLLERFGTDQLKALNPYRSL